MAQVALVENANTQNITIVSEGNYRLTLPDGSQVSPVEVGWVGANYRLVPVNFDEPAPTYIAITSIGSNNGTGYTNGDFLTVSGGVVEGNVGQLQVHGIGANGLVTSLIVANAGYYTTNPSIADNLPTGGTGSGLLVDLVVYDYSVANSNYVYDTGTNTVTQTNTYETPVIDNSESLERQRQEELDGDPNNVSLKDKLRTASRAQIDTWLLNNVTNLAEARNVLGAIVKFLAQQTRLNMQQPGG